jgi:hypothetical protein
MNFISIFPHIKAVTGGKRMKLLTVLRHIQDGRWQQLVEQVRATTDKKQRNAKKAEAPYFTVSGTFPGKRCDDGLDMHSSYIALDADKGPKNPDLDAKALKQAVAKDSFTYSAFISIGGEGLCIIFKVPEGLTQQTHGASFRALAAYFKQEYGVVVDSLGDPSRPRYISYDPDMYLNENAATFEETLEEPAPKPVPALTLNTPRPVAATYGQAKLRMAAEKVLTAPDGSKHTTLNKMGFVLGGYVATGYILEREAIDCLLNAINARGNVDNMEDAEKVIRRSITEGQGRPIFPDEVTHIVHRKLEQGQPVEMIAATISAADGVDRRIAEQVVQLLKDQENLKLETFWDVIYNEKKETNTLLLSKVKYTQFLEESGFRKSRQGKGYTTVRILSGIVEEVTRGQVKDFVMAYLHELPVKFDSIYRAALIDLVIRENRGMFDEGIMEFLSELPENFVKDTKTCAYFFFRNGYTRVSRTAVELLPYETLPGLIWSQQILDRDFQYVDLQESEDPLQFDFYRFLTNLCNQDEQRLHAMLSSIGYLLHGFKVRTHAYAIILCDEQISSGPAGRTGKGIIIQALTHIRNTVKIDGRNFRIENQFAYQRVQADTHLIAFEDVNPKRLPFDRLFSILTEGLSVEKKQLGEIYIPFEDSPKIIISTNEAMVGEGGSYEGRMREIEVAPYYSSSFNPEDDFGRIMFDDWPAEEWQLFDNLMLYCTQFYMMHGVVRQKAINLNRRKLMLKTCNEFAEFMETLSNEVEYGTRTLRNNFIAASGFEEKEISERKFFGWLKDWAYYEGLEIVRDQETTAAFPGMPRERTVKFVPHAKAKKR